jgi:hypothetical protein
MPWRTQLGPHRGAVERRHAESTGETLPCAAIEPGTKAREVRVARVRECLGQREGRGMCRVHAIEHATVEGQPARTAHAQVRVPLLECGQGGDHLGDRPWQDACLEMLALVLGQDAACRRLPESPGRSGQRRLA